ncbi:hypothetical protein FOA52_005942 [Chlamydomonas sp. UWO 241]|nr:hypothetical protein FOA52_005942 [Chlamydomonas sp. UWO 241]
MPSCLSLRMSDTCQRGLQLLDGHRHRRVRAVCWSSVAATSRRSAVVVKASAESRRAVLGGFLASAVLVSSKAAFAAATPVDIIDDRKAIATGFDLIYDARDLDLPQNERDGITQGRTDLEATKLHVKEAEKRIDTQLDKPVAKAYWTEAREELRRQVGTLRLDLNALAASKPKAERKAVLELNKSFLLAVEQFDFALRKKDGPAATAKLAAVKSTLDAVIAVVC